MHDQEDMGWTDIPGAAAAATAQVLKPLLRGWLHAIAGVVAVPLTVGLTLRSVHDPARMVAVLVYGLGMIQLYSISAIYHIGTWRGRTRQVLRAIDHANIFVMIAATYTPISVIILTGRWRVTVLMLIWALAAMGAALTILFLRGSRRLKTVLYASMGLLGLTLLHSLANTLPTGAVVLVVTGGLLYLLGGIVYALQRPDPLPRIFGYHEIFHVFVVGGGAVFAVTIWVWVVPFR